MRHSGISREVQETKDKKSRIRETPNLSTDSDRSTNFCLLKEEKNTTYGRQRISRPMQKVGPIQFWRGCVIYLI